jgi:hypothetical protein
VPADFNEYDIEREHAGLINIGSEMIRDLFKITDSNPCAFFTHVWNHLSERRTTFQQDLHTMMAILFGLHADQVYGREGPNTQNGSNDQKMLVDQEADMGQDPNPRSGIATADGMSSFV